MSQLKSDTTHELQFSICIPTYNGERWISETIESVLSQSFQDFEIIVSDDCSTDSTVEQVKAFKDKKIKIYKNKKNLGYGKNMQVLTGYANKEVLFLLAQDDILLKDALKKTHDAFFLTKDVGAVARPYYQFMEDPKIPVRIIPPYDQNQDTVMYINGNKKAIWKFFDVAGQLSGLAYLRKYLDLPFNEEIFTSHIYPYASIAKRYKVVFLKDYTVAVRILSSQTRFIKGIYDLSPTESWVRMINFVFAEDKHKIDRKFAIQQAAMNFLGLVQIKNYSSLNNLFKESFIMVKYRFANIIDPRFWFFFVGVLIIPKKFLIWLVDTFKNKILTRKYHNININLPDKKVNEENYGSYKNS